MSVWWTTATPPAPAPVSSSRLQRRNLGERLNGLVVAQWDSLQNLCYRGGDGAVIGRLPVLALVAEMAHANWCLSLNDRLPGCRHAKRASLSERR